MLDAVAFVTNENSFVEFDSNKLSTAGFLHELWFPFVQTLNPWGSYSLCLRWGLIVRVVQYTILQIKILSSNNNFILILFCHMDFPHPNHLFIVIYLKPNPSIYYVLLCYCKPDLLSTLVSCLMWSAHSPQYSKQYTFILQILWSNFTISIPLPQIPYWSLIFGRWIFLFSFSFHKEETVTTSLSC